MTTEIKTEISELLEGKGIDSGKLGHFVRVYELAEREYNAGADICCDSEIFLTAKHTTCMDEVKKEISVYQ